VDHRCGRQGGNLLIAVAQAAADQGQGIAVLPGATKGQGLTARLTALLELPLQLRQQLQAAAPIGGVG
jgi:hypothetical protein